MIIILLKFGFWATKQWSGSQHIRFCVQLWNNKPVTPLKLASTVEAETYRSFTEHD